MTITYGPAYVPIDDPDLLIPPSLAPALTKALEASNVHYRQWLPSPLTACLTAAPLIARSSSFRLPIDPSADDLTYSIRHVLITGTGTTGIDVTIEEQAAGGGWSTIYVTTAHAAGATATVEISTSATIASTSDEIRITYDRGADPYTAISATVIPAPGSPAARTDAGFWPYDDGAIGGGAILGAGAPINTEFVNRPMRNARAVIADRSQCLASWAQESTPADVLASTEDSTQAAGLWVMLGTGYASLPFVGADIEIEAAAIASVDAGATAGLIRVDVGDATLTLDADNAVNTATATVTPLQAGALAARLPITLWAKSMPGQITYPHAITVRYRPAMPSALVIATPDAPAAISTLWLATRGAELLMLRPWAQPALCYVGNLADLTVRRFFASIPPACQRAQVAIVRSTTIDGALQTATTIETTTASSVPAGAAADVVTVAAVSRGTESFFSVNGDEAFAIVQWSSDSLIDASPAATKDRLLPLVEALAAGVETIQITLSLGCALHLTAVRPPSGWQDI